MSPKFQWIAPDASIQEAAQMMKAKDIGFLPVAENDKMIGTITDRDIAINAVAMGKDASSCTVRDCMNQKLYYCYEDQTADEICKNMAEMQVSRFPVVNHAKRLVGIVSYADLSACASPAVYTSAQQELKSVPPAQKAA
ncbi:MAG TPA: CBS domain-containing protein [Rhodospirillaceae bacterium]|nr:CBS domain-containing protein [Rhodospirillaceae bacterium]